MDVWARETSAWQEAFQARARPLTARWRRQRLLHRALATLWLPVAVNLALLILLRWTLIDLPGHEALLLLPVPIWLVGMGVWWLFDRPALMRQARAADRALGLDERLATALEGTRRPAPADPGSARLARRQREDALGALSDAGDAIRQTFPLVPGRHLRPLGLAAGISLLALPAMFLPNPVEPLRIERDALQAAVLRQADTLRTGRREAVARPNLPPDTSALIDEQLRAAEDRLRANPTDRGGAVAALSQSEDRLRKALPPDFQQQLATSSSAARDIQAALPPDNRTEDPPPGASDLTKAALSAEQLSAALTELLATGPASQLFASAGNLESAASTLDGADPALAAKLRAAATAIRKGDAAAAQKALADAAAGLRQLDAAQTGISSLVQAVDQLDQSRSAIAQAGLPASAANSPDSQRQRFGLQSGGVGPSGGTTLDTAPGSGRTTGAGTQPGAGSTPGAGSGPGQPGQTGPSQTGGSGSTNPGTGSTLSGGGGQGTNATQGNQQGTGTGAAPTPGTGLAQDGGTGAPESVYVPEGETGKGNSSGPQDTLNLPSSSDGAAKDSSVVRVGPGVNNGVHTPYQDVIGKYNDSAASALDRSAIPTDAKQYVKDYFRSLQPQPQK